MSARILDGRQLALKVKKDLRDRDSVRIKAVSGEHFI